MSQSFEIRLRQLLNCDFWDCNSSSSSFSLSQQTVNEEKDPVWGSREEEQIIIEIAQNLEDTLEWGEMISDEELENIFQKVMCENYQEFYVDGCKMIEYLSCAQALNDERFLYPACARCVEENWNTEQYFNTIINDVSGKKVNHHAKYCCMYCNKLVVVLEEKE